MGLTIVVEFAGGGVELIVGRVGHGVDVDRTSAAGADVVQSL